LASSLDAAGHEVSVTWVDNGTWPRSSFWNTRPLHRLPNPRSGRRKRYFLRFMRQFAGLLRRERPQAVLAVDPPALLPAALLKPRLGFRLVYDSREYYTELPSIRDRVLVSGFWRMGEGLGLRRCESAFSVCASIARELERLYGVDGLGVIRNLPRLGPHRAKIGRPESPTERSERRRTLRELVPELGESPVVLYQGGFWRGYDFRPLMEALGAVESGDTEAPGLVLLGDGPGRAEHLEYAGRLPWAERIHFPGKVPADRLSALTRGADLGTVLVPDRGLSYRFLLPNKLFEYVQAGLPLLVSPLPELSAVVRGRGIGLTADPADADSIARALERLLEPGWKEDRGEALRGAALDLCWENEEELFLEHFDGSRWNTA